MGVFPQDDFWASMGRTGLVVGEEYTDYGVPFGICLRFERSGRFGAGLLQPLILQSECLIQTEQKANK